MSKAEVVEAETVEEKPEPMELISEIKTVLKDMAGLEKALVSNDLSDMEEGYRIQYVIAVCKSLKLNPTTQPFQFISMNGALRLYATKDCTEQLRKIHGVSIYKMEKVISDDGDFEVTVYGEDKTGRKDIATGAIPIGTLSGPNRSNAKMKCETKAKRRLTLSICGLGFLDESEIESIPGAKVVNHNYGNLEEEGYTGNGQQYIRKNEDLAQELSLLINTKKVPKDLIEMWEESYGLKGSAGLDKCKKKDLLAMHDDYASYLADVAPDPEEEVAE